MSDLLPGDLLLTRSSGAVGALIRYGETVRVHGWRAAIVRLLRWIFGLSRPVEVDDPTWGNHIAVVGEACLIEALAGGLTRSPLNKYGPGQYRHLPLASVLPNVTDRDRGRLAAFAEAELAKRPDYSWLGIFSICVQLLTPTRFDVSVDGSMICSAFGARCWEHAGVTVPTLSPYTTMPSDLAGMVPEIPTISTMSTTRKAA